jgi:16S rRNA (guanine966-N2)-methyltransferase
VRIIGGDLRGKKLFSPRDRSVRPTADRLRESIFNIIAAEVPEAVVLDLFAGTGALGIEALSRGAASAWFVDRSAAALSLLEKNLSACNLTGRSRRIRWDIVKNLHCLSGVHPPFTLVFVDPPYGRGLLSATLVHLRRSRSAASGALVVIEHDTDEPLDEPGNAYHIEDRRRYGKSLVSFARYLV